MALRTTSTQAIGRRSLSLRHAVTGDIRVAASTADVGYTCVLAEATWQRTSNASHVHVTTNETIGGVEWFFVPETGDTPLVADMSSHLLSRPIDVSRYGVIYAGAQKNIGPAGLTVVIVRDDLTGRARWRLSVGLLDYAVQAKAGSMFNTLPTFAIYVADLHLRLACRARAASRASNAPMSGKRRRSMPRSIAAASTAIRCVSLAYERPVLPSRHAA